MNDNERGTRHAQNATPEQPGRRRLLKLLAGTGAASAVYSMPVSWTRPLVEAVILPAQAQLSETTVLVYSASSIAISEMQQWLDGPLRPLRQLAGVRQEPGRSIHDYFDVPRPAPSPALLDFFVSPAEAIITCETPPPITASASVTLFLDVGDILQVVIDLDLNFTCHSFDPCVIDNAPRSGNLRFCWEGAITGTTTPISASTGNCEDSLNGGITARIVSRDDAAGTVTVEVLGQPYVLTRSGARQTCVPCAQQFADLSEDIFGVCGEDAGVIQNTLVSFTVNYFGVP